MRRTLLALPLIALAIGFLCAVHYYIARRLVLDPGLPEPWRGALLALLVGCAAALVLQPFGERLLRPPFSRAIAWPASVWMGFAFLILIQLLVSDALLWISGSSALAAPAGAEASSSSAGIRAALVAGVALVAGTVGLRTALQPPRLERVEIPLRRWPRELDGFRIVQVSDLHIGPILGRRFAARLVERVNALDADLVAVTGDLVDGAVRQLADEVAPFAGFRSRHGTFFVTGNHDHYSGADAWAENGRRIGWRVLRNERSEIRVGDAIFDLVGVDDHRGSVFGRDGGEDLEAALAERDAERPAILLAHDPSTFKRAALQSVDLQLSGHTHGGQIWPFHWFIRLVIPFVAGRYRRGEAELYVSRGTGFWGPPMRLPEPAEISEIVLRAGTGSPGSVASR
jgi:predicted MPP superfamily phosphohydrolase